MSAVNAVLVDSTELFPRGTVVLNGVKPFKQEGLEEAVLAAGTLVQQLGGPLCGVFEQVFSEHEGELPEVEKAAFGAGNGVVGTVDGKEMVTAVNDNEGKGRSKMWRVSTRRAADRSCTLQWAASFTPCSS